MLDYLLTKLFGMHTRSVENPVIANTGGAVAVLFMRNNPDRLAWTLINLGVNPLYVGLTDQVAAANGIYIAANGGRVTAKYDEDFQMTGWAWWAISPAGADAIYSLEVLGSK